MQLIIREYIRSLRERDELDAILPDLLSEVGFTVFSRPRRGSAQRGVDVGAVGPASEGEQCVHLFCIKAGDLTRQEWDGSPQSVRSSLNEIIDAYLPNRIPPQYGHLRIKICVCFGGDMLEQVREVVTGYFKQNTTARISFEEWNGDKIAKLISSGILGEGFLLGSTRAKLQKSIALVDEPDVSYRYFSELLEDLSVAGRESSSTRLLPHCTMQAWIPSNESEEHMYVNSEAHGRAVCNLRVSDGDQLIQSLVGACEEDQGFSQLSACSKGFWPIVLMACRHWKLPVPPNLWIESLRLEGEATEDATKQDHASGDGSGGN